MMAKKPKKSLTPTQQKRRYKTLSKACLFGQFGSLVAPFITIGLIKFNDYFVEYDGWKISIAGVMAAFVMGIIVLTVTNKKIKNSYGTIIICIAIITACLFLIERIIYDLKFILIGALVGLCGALGLEKEGENLENKAEKIQKGIESAEEQITRDAYLEEQEERNDKRTIKVKVRKDE